MALVSLWLIVGCGSPTVAEFQGTCTAPLLATIGSSEHALVDGSVAPAHIELSSQMRSAIVGIAWQVDQKQGFCSGTLIAAKTVLTAAHCVVDTERWNGHPETAPTLKHPPEAFAVFTESQDAKAPRQSASVRRVTLHPAFDGTDVRRRDLALLHLIKPLTGVLPLPLYIGDLRAVRKARIYISGYGSTRCHEAVTVSKERRWGLLELSELTQQYLLLTNRGAGTPTFGDSGAGIFVKHGNTLWLIGVLTARLDTSCKHSAATRIADHYDWLQSHTAQFCGTRISTAAKPSEPSCAQTLACLETCQYAQGWCVLSCLASLPTESFESWVRWVREPSNPPPCNITNDSADQKTGPG